MTRRLVLWILLVSFSAGMALHTSLKVRTQEERLQEIHRAIADEQERIRVLTAEWHMLKSPARLETLAGRHLNALKRIKPEQMAELDRLPTPETLAMAEAAVEKGTVSERPVLRDAAPSAAPATKPVEQVAQKTQKKAEGPGREEDLATLIARVTPVTTPAPPLPRQQERSGEVSGRQPLLPKATLGEATVWGQPVREGGTSLRPQTEERGNAGSIGDLIRREGRAEAGGSRVVLASTGTMR